MCVAKGTPDTPVKIKEFSALTTTCQRLNEIAIREIGLRTAVAGTSGSGFKEELVSFTNISSE